MSGYDAVVVGSGPNGLAAAIRLAQAGCAVLVVEAHDTVGGGARSAPLTLPGFVHDVCSAIHPLGYGSPYLRTLPLEQHGLHWIQPDIPVAHPLDGGRGAALYQSLGQTTQALGPDGPPWQHYFSSPASTWETLAPDILGPLRWPNQLAAYVAFGLRAPWPAGPLAHTIFRTEAARALFAGLAAHAMQPLHYPLTASFALVLGLLGHTAGWPFPQGGAQAISDALTGYLRSLGGDVVAGWTVHDLAELPATPITILDVSPRSLIQITGDRLPASYRRQLQRYRYGCGVFKIDYALDGPVPWSAEVCRRAGTVHVGGTLAEIAASERAMWRGQHTTRPYVLVAQPTVADPSRAPEGCHTLWAYCHVPRGSTVDMSAAIETQIERFAPGFQARILARSTLNTAQLEAYNPNYVGGDINVGVQTVAQTWTRPSRSLTPYRTPIPGLYLCSSATPPGGGVHGMCGYHAASIALQDRS